jgi:hypothetical protein
MYLPDILSAASADLALTTDQYLPSHQKVCQIQVDYLVPVL